MVYKLFWYDKLGVSQSNDIEEPGKNWLALVKYARETDYSIGKANGRKWELSGLCEVSVCHLFFYSVKSLLVYSVQNSETI